MLAEVCAGGGSCWQGCVLGEPQVTSRTTDRAQAQVEGNSFPNPFL